VTFLLAVTKCADNALEYLQQYLSTEIIPCQWIMF